jgi:hypothetical protein
LDRQSSKAPEAGPRRDLERELESKLPPLSLFVCSSEEGDDNLLFWFCYNKKGDNNVFYVFSFFVVAKKATLLLPFFMFLFFVAAKKATITLLPLLLFVTTLFSFRYSEEGDCNNVTFCYGIAATKKAMATKLLSLFVMVLLQQRRQWQQCCCHLLFLFSCNEESDDKFVLITFFFFLQRRR